MKKAILFALAAGWVIAGVLGAGATAAQALSVPLPSTLPLLGLGLAALFTTRRRGR